jgi:hypothetical protein
MHQNPMKSYLICGTVLYTRLPVLYYKQSRNHEPDQCQLLLFHVREVRFVRISLSCFLVPFSYCLFGLCLLRVSLTPQ